MEYCQLQMFDNEQMIYKEFWLIDRNTTYLISLGKKLTWSKRNRIRKGEIECSEANNQEINANEKSGS